MGIRMVRGTFTPMQGFVPSTIYSATAGEDEDVSEWVAMRVNAAAAYKIVRVFAEYVGDSTDGSDGTDTFSIGEKKSWETLEVWVEGVKKTLTTHYTVSGSDVIFTAGNVPLIGEVIEMYGVSPEATMPAGAVSIVTENARYFRFTGNTTLEVMEG